MDETLSKAITGDGSVWLDKWWSVIFNTSKHPVLSAVVKGSLLIFTGLQLKSSFSMMNNIITKKLGRMLSETHSAIFHCYSICVFWTISLKKHFQRSSQPPSCIRLQCSASQYCSIFLLCKISGKIWKTRCGMPAWINLGNRFSLIMFSSWFNSKFTAVWKTEKIANNKKECVKFFSNK